MNTKTCTKCGTNKPLNDYYNHDGTKDGKRSDCKQCKNATSRTWRETNPERHRANAQSWRKANPERNKANKKRWNKLNTQQKRGIVNAWKLQQKQCADCGWQITPERLVAIDCDHIDPTTKTFELSTAIHKTHTEIVTELNKCVARCKNCHAIRTHQEQHHLHRNIGTAPLQPEPPVC